MKKLNIKLIALFSVLLVWGCTYEFPKQTEDNPGTADFGKYVAIGNSLTAGYQGQSLYTASQDNSLPAILAQQFALVGGGDFNQPDIDSEHGYSGEGGGITFGRLVFGDDGSGAGPTPVGTPGLQIPNNSGDLRTDYTGDKTALNNFGVPGMKIIHAQVPGYGIANGYFGRFASNAATATVLGDATAALADGGTFFTMWLGNNDVLVYATSGATDPADLTDVPTFTAAYNAAVSAVLTSAPEAKGVLANIPNVTDIPYFTTVVWNPLPLAQTSADALNAAYADYNNGLQLALANMLITQEEADYRTIEFIESDNNAVVIEDESLTDLSGLGLPNYRQTTADDLLTLTAGAQLPIGGGTQVPLGDQYVLIPDEITEIGNAVTAFNAVIAQAVEDNSSQLGLADINSVLETLKEEGVEVNGSSLVASILPPYGAFSADGVHPNTRAYAYLANEFLKVINSKFNAQVPYVNPNDYFGNDLPYPIIK